MKYIFRSLFLLILFSTIMFSQNIRFAWLSDLHVGNSTGEEDLELIVNDINSGKKVDFVIISGDVTESGKTEDFMKTKNILSKLNAKYYIIPGNHDTKWSESGGESFKNIFGNDRFHFLYNKIHFIGLHQGPIIRMADGNFAPEDLRWLKKELKKVSKKEDVIFISHYPIDSSISNWYEFIDIIKPLNVKAILVGHGHTKLKMNFEGFPGIMGRSTLRTAKVETGYNIVNITNDSILFSEKIVNKEELPCWHKLSTNEKIDKKKEYPRPDFNVNSEFPDIKLKWSFDCNHTVTAEPVTTTKGILVASRSGLFLLDKMSGKKIWKFSTKGAFFAAPAADDYNVLITSTDGNIYSLKLKTGKLQWKFPTGKPVVSVPLIKSNHVYFGSAGKFYKLDIREGKKIWEFDFSEGFVESKPAICDNKIVFGAWSTFLYCLDVESGNLLWKWSNDRKAVLLSPAVCYPVITDRKVFIVAPDRYMTVINLETGKTIFRTNRNYVREAIGISEDSALIFTKSMYDSAFAYRIKDDTLLLEWKQDLKFGYDFAPSYPIEKNGTLFFGVKNGYLYALSAVTGDLKWRFRVCSSLVNNVLPISDKEVIVTSLNGRVYYLFTK